MKLTVKEIQRAISAIDDEIEFCKQKLNKNYNYDTPRTSAEQTELTTKKYIESLDELFDTMYNMRKLVKQFNADKIDDKSADIAKIDQQNDILKDIQRRGQPEPVSSYSSTKMQYSSGYTLAYEQELRNKIKENQRKIQSLKDSCAGINASHKIDVSEDIESVLNKYSLI